MESWWFLSCFQGVFLVFVQSSGIYFIGINLFSKHTSFGSNITFFLHQNLIISGFSAWSFAWSEAGFSAWSEAKKEPATALPQIEYWAVLKLINLISQLSSLVSVACKTWGYWAYAVASYALSLVHFLELPIKFYLLHCRAFSACFCRLFQRPPASQFQRLPKCIVRCM